MQPTTLFFRLQKHFSHFWRFPSWHLIKTIASHLSSALYLSLLQRKQHQMLSHFSATILSLFYHIHLTLIWKFVVSLFVISKLSLFVVSLFVVSKFSLFVISLFVISQLSLFVVSLFVISKLSLFVVLLFVISKLTLFVLFNKSGL